MHNELIIEINERILKRANNKEKNHSNNNKSIWNHSMSIITCSYILQ